MKRKSLIRILAVAILLVGATLWGRGYQKTIAGIRNLSPPPKPKFALLVGINDYIENSIKDLKGPENDVAAMKKLLVKQYEFPDDTAHIMTLLTSQATKDAITRTFKEHLIGNATQNRDATIVFYYSGHGSQVKDANEDEDDGWDETIVPVDSRQANRFDIIDDEIGEWFEQLNAALDTNRSNVTFIMDSCHSGTGTKLLDDSVIEREVPADLRPQPPQKPRPQSQAGKAKDLDWGNGILPRSRRYMAIAGCLPYELSYETEFPEGSGAQSHGFLTYYLTHYLARNPNVSYRHALNNVANSVSAYRSQHPQVEGDIDRMMFGGAAQREDRPINIVGPVVGKTFKIDMGSAHGVKEGTFIAVYGPQVGMLIGDQGKIANARITKVESFTSTAEMSQAPATPIPKDAKVAIITPNFGANKLAVAIESIPAPATSETPAFSALRAVAAAVGNSKVLTPVIAPAGQITSRAKAWRLAVMRGQFKSIKNRLMIIDESKVPSDDAEVFYLIASDSDQPLFNFWIQPTSNNAQEAAQEIVMRLENKSFQEQLRALTNTVSPLTARVKITTQRVSGGVNNGVFIPSGAPPVVLAEDQLGTAYFELGEGYNFKIENLSDSELFITTFYLGTSGSIGIFSRDKLRNGDSVTTKPFGIGPPLGLETYKFIITKKDIDFRNFERPGARRKGLDDPLLFLIDEMSPGAPRDPLPAADLDVSSWSTMQVDFVIRKKNQGQAQPGARR